MNSLYFQTAVPFGYLLFWTSMFILMVTGFALVAMGWRHRPRVHARVMLGCVLIFFVITVFLINLDADRSLEFNAPLTQANVLGEWREGQGVLSIGKNGRFECTGAGECDSLGKTGIWRLRGDFELEFQSDEKGVIIRRVILYRGHQRLTKMEGDPDMWNGKLTFEHILQAR